MSSRSIGAVTLVALSLFAAACSSSPPVASGRSVDVFGPYRGGEADAFTDSLAVFTERTGVEVRYIGSADFVSDLRARVVTGNPPDIALIPQPSLIDELVEAEQVVPITDAARSLVQANFGDDGIERRASHDDHVVPYRSSIKSLVWYRPAVFEANGWSVPETMDELIDLTERIVSGSDLEPWCLGIRSGSATGWPLTDWLEDLVLRLSGPDTYDAWRRGDDVGDAVAEALDTLGELVVEDNIVGNRRLAARTDVDDAVDPLFADDGCALFKQADFALSWMPSGTTIGTDVDVFVLPGITLDEPPPLVIGGDGAVQFDDDPDVSALMEFLATPESAARWAARGGYLSARTSVDRSTYYHPNSAPLATLLDVDRVIRFDASDRFPIGAVVDEYHPALTQWLAGSLDAAAAAAVAAAVNAPDEAP